MTPRVIIIPFHNPHAWHTDYANQTATLLSQHTLIFCFLWGDALSVKEWITQRTRYHMIQKQKNIVLFRPLFLIPGKRFFPVQQINLLLNTIIARIYCIAHYGTPLNMHLFWYFGSFDPVFYMLPYLWRGTSILYDMVDFPWAEGKNESRRVVHTHEYLLSRAILVTANSRTLTTLVRPHRPDVLQVPLGFDPAPFTRRPKAQKHTNYGDIVLIGAIDYRIDYRILYRITTAHPDWTFGLIGPWFDDNLSESDKRLREKIYARANVIRQTVVRNEIPSVLASARAGIIPYKTDSTFNRYCFPMKCMEYWYAGLPIIASDILELRSYKKIATICTTYAQWENALQHTLTPTHRFNTSYAKKTALHHTWRKKIYRIRVALNSTEI